MKWPKPRNEPPTIEENNRAIRFFAACFLVLTVLIVYFGITGYYAPIPSFENYLKSLPPGFTSRFNIQTYEFYFQGSYLVQVFLGIPLIPAWIFIMLKPERTIEFIDRIFKRLGLDD